MSRRRWASARPRRLYAELDGEFREWLESIDPSGGESIADCRGRWRDRAREIALRLGREMAARRAPGEIIGAAKPLSDYEWQIRKIYPKGGE